MNPSDVVCGAFYEGVPGLALFPDYCTPVIVKATSRPNHRGRLSCQILGPDHNHTLTIQKDRGCDVEQLVEQISPAVVTEAMALARIVDLDFCS